MAIKFRKQSIATLARRLDGEVVYIKSRSTTVVTVSLFILMTSAYFLYSVIKPEMTIAGYASMNGTQCDEATQGMCVVYLYTDAQTAKWFEPSKNVLLSFLAPETLEQSFASGELTDSLDTNSSGRQGHNIQNKGKKVWIASVAVRKETVKLIFGGIQGTSPQAVTILTTDSQTQPAGASRNRL